jgi:hypothetical protein
MSELTIFLKGENMTDEAQEVQKEDPEVLKIRKAEKKCIAKHGDRVVEGSAERVGNKVTVLIRTWDVNGDYDGNTRRVATSDVHQVFHLPEVKAELDKQKAKERRSSKKESEAVTAE